MANNFKQLQAQNFTLAGAGSSIGDTSLILSSMLTIDGIQITMTDIGSKGYFTADPGNGSQEEAGTFTGITQNVNGTATLTGVSHQMFEDPYTETSGMTKSHTGGVSLVLSNTAGFYQNFLRLNDSNTVSDVLIFTNPNYPQMDVATPFPTLGVQLATKAYVDSVTIAGAPKATDTVYGISKLSVAAVSPTNPIVVGTNDGRVPTQNENDALVGTVGAPSSINKYVTNDDTSGTGVVLRSSMINSYGNPFGDGNDGTVTWDGSTTILGMSPVANVYTLTRDIYVDTGTVNNTVTINTNGYRISVKTLLTNNGIIQRNGNNGGNASAGTAGIAAAALASGTLFGSVAGVVGATGTNVGGGNSSATAGTNGIAITTSVGVSGTAGGIASGNPANAQTIAGTFTASTQGVRNLTFAITMSEFMAGTLAALKTASGSGSGSAGGSNSAGQEGGGGGSGSSGGIVWISAKTLVNNGTISANGGNGGNGGNGTSGAFSGSGGGPGAGGVIILITHTITLGTITVNAGTPGAGGTGGAGTGGTAPAGNAGVIYNFIF